MTNDTGDTKMELISIIAAVASLYVAGRMLGEYFSR